MKNIIYLIIPALIAISCSSEKRECKFLQYHIEMYKDLENHNYDSDYEKTYFADKEDIKKEIEEISKELELKTQGMSQKEVDELLNQCPNYKKFKFESDKLQKGVMEKVIKENEDFILQFEKEMKKTIEQ